MNNLNWGSWFQGLIASLGSAAVAIIGVLLGLNACPTGWELTKIAILPAALGFFLYIKQTPPPFGVTTTKTTLSKVDTADKSTTEITSTTKSDQSKPGDSPANKP